MARTTASGSRLLHLIGSIDPAQGGPVEALTQLYRVYLPQGVDIEVATLDQPDAPFLKSYPFKVHALGRAGATEQWATTKLPWVRYRYSPLYARWLRQNLHRFSAVIVHGLWTYTTSGAVGPMLEAKTPYLVFTHGALDPWFRRAYPLKHAIKQLVWWIGDGRLLNHARRVLFTTEEERLLSRDAFFPYAVHERVVGYGIADPPPPSPAQAEAFRQITPELAGRRYLLYLSRIHPKKGCDLLIQAFADIARRDPGLDLVMAGPDGTGWSGALKAIAAREGIGDRIHWPGSLHGDAKWGAYRGCEAFVLPSHQENFGIVVAEALACGKPVLVSNKVNIWREVEADGAGLVEDDTLAGTRALLNAWADQGEEAQRARGLAARACFVERFDIRKTSEDILSVISEVLPDVDP